MKTRRWSIAYREWPSGLPTIVDRSSFTIIEPPCGVSYADPFLFENDNRTFLFFEQFMEGDYFSGTISFVELDGTHWTVPRNVLRDAYHMSYPLVFGYEGQIYMLPETRQKRTVEVYKAVDFPTEWFFYRTLISNIQAVDSTMLVRPEGLYLFSWVYDDDFTGRLHVFYASCLQGPWTPIPCSSRGYGRPAGRVLTVDNVLLRPSQSEVGGYGSSIILNEIDELTTGSFVEKPRFQLRSRTLSQPCGIHTFNRSSRYEVVDLWTE